jgi:gluconolactonase
MCLTTKGDIVATAGWDTGGPGSMVYVFSPTGKIVEMYPFPVDRPTNCTFGGYDLNILYVTSIDGYLYKTVTNLEGRLLYPTRQRPE